MKQDQKIIKIIKTSILVGLVICVVVFQLEYDATRPQLVGKLDVTRQILLPERILPFVSFGFNAFLADVYWIAAIQDFVTWDTKNPSYITYFNNISTLDPKFEYPYLFSIFTVPQHKDLKTLDSIAIIADRGIQAIPVSWKIPFYLGTKYYVFTKNNSPADTYLKIAATREGAPKGLYLFYSSFATKNITGHKITQGLMSIIYNTTDNETIKKIAARGLQEDVINQVLEKGITAYKLKYKHYPTSVEEMIQNGMILLPPGLLENFDIEINQQSGSFRIVER